VQEVRAISTSHSPFPCKTDCYQEFSKLAEDANIYKLVGPVLMKQDRKDATMAVDGRLEYISKEM
jgi:chaperonin cofactor prefoldin